MTIKSSRNVRKTISIPERFDTAAREDIGQRLVKRIKDRTRSGIDVNNQAFKYAKGSPHSGDNLEDSGDMLSELEILSTTKGKITIGYADLSSVEANQAEGNQLGTYGQNRSNPSIAKPFIGVSKRDLDLVIAQHESSRPKTDGEIQRETAVNSFIANLLTSQGIIDDG